MASFEHWRSQMTAELVEHAARTAEAQTIEADVERRLPRQHPDPAFELRRALDDNFRYGRACRRRDAALRRASGYGIAAMVEAMATVLDGDA